MRARRLGAVDSPQGAMEQPLLIERQAREPQPGGRRRLAQRAARPAVHLPRPGRQGRERQHGYRRQSHLQYAVAVRHWRTKGQPERLLAAVAPHLLPLLIFLQGRGARMSETVYLDI